MWQVSPGMISLGTRLEWAMQLRAFLITFALLFIATNCDADDIQQAVDSFYSDLTQRVPEQECIGTLIRLGQENNDPQTEARGHLRRGFLKARPRNDESGWRQDIEKGVRLAGAEPSIARAEALMFGGFTKARADNNFDAALADLEAAIQLACELQDNKTITMAHLLAGELYMVKTQYSKSREYALRALHFADLEGFEPQIRTSLYRVLLAFERSRLYDAAAPYAERQKERTPQAQRIQYYAGKQPDYPQTRLAELAGLDEFDMPPALKAQRRAALRLELGCLLHASQPTKAKTFLGRAEKWYREQDDEFGRQVAEVVSTMIPDAGITNEKVLSDFKDAVRTTGSDAFDFFGRDGILYAVDVPGFLEKHNGLKEALQWRTREVQRLKEQTAATVTDPAVAANAFFEEQIAKRKLKAQMNGQEEEMAAERAAFAEERQRFSRTSRILLGIAGLALALLFATRFALISRHRKQLVEEVHRKTASLEEASRAAEDARDQAERADQAKTEFLACMNHELRNPLNAILGSCQLLHHKTSGSAPQPREVETIKASSEHLLQLVNNVLDVSSIEHSEIQLHRTEFDLHQLCRSVNSILELSATARSIAFFCELDSSVPTFVRGDGSKLRQVLLNLCANGIKFTSQGHVRLKLSAQKLGQDNIMLTARVTDTGSGIDPQELERMFQPWNQSSDAKTRRSGNGLGLFICKTFVDRMGGFIKADSTPGSGSEFRMSVPLEIADAQAHQPASTKETSTEKPTVLVVDDNPDNLLVISQLLETMGHATVAAIDKNSALTSLSHNKPAFVFMDIHMPGADGFEILSAMRQTEAGQRARIVAVTGDALESVRQRALDQGFDAFLPKPIRVDSIEKAIRQTVDR